MIKSKLVKIACGKIRIIEGYKNYTRLYVKKTNLKTYAVSDNIRLSFDSMTFHNLLYSKVNLYCYPDKN